jgi:hypothetical protein
MIIKPTVGRVVLYHPEIHEGAQGFDQPFAAIVCHVHGDRLVNLVVFDANGHSFPKTSVVLKQDDGEAVPGRPYAEWMDYQKGQAERAERAEKQLAEHKQQTAAAPAAAPAPIAPAPGRPSERMGKLDPKFTFP